MEKFDMEKWRLQDRDRHSISECSKCSKSYYNPIWISDPEEPKNPRRSQLLVCRVCFFEITQNLTPEMEILFKLIDKSTELYDVQDELRKVYDSLIDEQRTTARIELDKYQEEQRSKLKKGHMFFGRQPRPEGFVGDPPLKRCDVVFGLDLGGPKGVYGPDGPLIDMNPRKVGEGCQ